jgi:NAD(P)-dependent dehydrogenase (short-subunit alcohol dehydrogenase family)
LNCLKHEIPAMLSGGGSIVNTSSTFGLVGSAGAQIYSASKHAVEGLTKSVALEVAGQGIRVNAVAPSMTVTPMFEAFGADEQTRAAMAAMHPVGRLGRPDDVARAVLFLLNPDNSFVTGTTVAVDGGWLAQ